MFNLKFDIKKFLELPLNDGRHYLGDGCGCIKGNFARSSNVVFGNAVNLFEEAIEEAKISGLLSSFILQPWADKISRSLGRFSCTILTPHFKGDVNLAKEQSTYFPRDLASKDCILAAILDHAEYILIIRQKPQFAKLFLIRALRKFGYIPQEEHIEQKELINA
jgi:hypothetical protein